MDFKKFLAYSMIGAFPWCMVLAFIGFILGENWESIMGASHLLSYAVAAIAAIIIVGAVTLYVLVKKGIIPKATVDRYLGFLTKA